MKLRILLLAHRLPYPPRTGDKVRAYHVARHLARNHVLTLACLVDDERPEQALTTLREEIPDLMHAVIPRRRQRLAAMLRLVGGGSATLGYFESPTLRRLVDRRLRGEGFDVIYVSSSSMAQYVSEAVRALRLVDFVDVDSDKWLQYSVHLPVHRAWLYRLEAVRLRRAELAAARQAHHCLVATPKEKALLLALAPWAPTTVVENGVDLDYFRPSPTPAAGPTIVFTGAMDYLPNIDGVVHFARRILPVVRERVSEARFLIVGKNPVAAVRRLTSLPGVHVTGSVPDVRPYMRQAAVAVAPLRIGRGVQNKILEAMATGLPVVATAKAHEGVERAEPQRHLLVEDEPVRFADAVIHLLCHPELRTAVGRAGREFVQTHHSWAATLATIDLVIAEAMEQRKAKPVIAGGLTGERM